MNSIEHTARGGARWPARLAPKGCVIAMVLGLLAMFSTDAAAGVLSDPSGNTLSQQAVTSGGGLLTAGGYTLNGAIGLLSGPVSQAPGSGTLFHGIPGPFIPSGPVPFVSGVSRVGAERTNAATVQFTVTFSEAVSGVDAADFFLATTGTLAGCAILSVSADTGTTRTVTVGTGTGDGLLRLDVVDDDTIQTASLMPLGGVGAGNGNHASGPAYLIDRTPPSGTIFINNNVSVCNSHNVTLKLTWDDGGGSGVVRMRFSDDGKTWTAWEPLAATKAWTLPAGEGYRTVRVMFRDAVGNNSPALNDFIRVDTIAPTGTIIINNGAVSTRNRNVSLKLTWADDPGGSGVVRMRFSIDGKTWTAWETLKATKGYTLPATTGKHYTVRVTYRDAGGNISPAANDYIRLDP